MCILKYLQRGIILSKNTVGSYGTVLCTLSDDALYFSQVLLKYLKRFKSYRLELYG